MKIELRPANVADVLIIQQIAHRTWPHTFGKILSPEQIAYMLDWMYSPESLRQQMTEQGHQFILAKANGEEVGYLSYEHNYKNTPKTKIHKAYLLPQWQGQGIGQRLFAAAESAARSVGSGALTLNVNRDNNAVGFYQYLGYEIKGTENIDIGSGYLMEDYIMEKGLTD